MEGTVFYLYAGQSLDDYKSNYTLNAGVKGQIYCDSCTAILNSSYFYYIAAYQGSLVFLKSYQAPGANVTFYNCEIKNGFSVSNGGGVATEGNYKSYISFL